MTDGEKEQSEIIDDFTGNVFPRLKKRCGTGSESACAAIIYGLLDACDPHQSDNCNALTTLLDPEYREYLMRPGMAHVFKFAVELYAERTGGTGARRAKLWASFAPVFELRDRLLRGLLDGSPEDRLTDIKDGLSKLVEDLGHYEKSGGPWELDYSLAIFGALSDLAERILQQKEKPLQLTPARIEQLEKVKEEGKDKKKGAFYPTFTRLENLQAVVELVPGKVTDSHRKTVKNLVLEMADWTWLEDLSLRFILEPLYGDGTWGKIR